MIKCHKCKLETKQLNGLMTKHYKMHCNEAYTKEQYKRDLLINNGRPPKNCKICSKETTIPKGENEYPDYCKQCYHSQLKSKTNELNVNWKGGKKIVVCRMCNEQLEKHESHLKRPNKFCSTSCAQSFYGLPENRTEAQKDNDIVQGNRLRRMTKEPYLRAKLAKARNTMATSRSSKKEQEVIKIIKTLYPDCTGGHLIKYYTFDGFIPELNLLVEFDGTYWHSLPKCIALDKRKTSYISKWHLNLRILRIPETDWDNATNKLQFLQELLTPFML
jgi:hypothetical protein